MSTYENQISVFLNSVKDKKRLSKKEFFCVLEIVSKFKKDDVFSTKKNVYRGHFNESKFKVEMEEVIFNRFLNIISEDIKRRKSFIFLIPKNNKPLDLRDKNFLTLVDAILENGFVFDCLLKKKEEFSPVAKFITAANYFFSKIINKIYNDLISDFNTKKNNPEHCNSLKLVCFFNLTGDLFFDTNSVSGNKLLEDFKGYESVVNKHTIYFKSLEGGKVGEARRLINHPLVSFIIDEKHAFDFCKNRLENKKPYIVALLKNNASIYKEEFSRLTKESKVDEFGEDVFYKPIFISPIDVISYKDYVFLMGESERKDVFTEEEFLNKRNVNVVFNVLFYMVYNKTESLDVLLHERPEQITGIHIRALRNNSMFTNWVSSLPESVLIKAYNYLNNIKNLPQSVEKGLVDLNKEKLEAVTKIVEKILLEKVIENSSLNEAKNNETKNEVRLVDKKTLRF